MFMFKIHVKPTWWIIVVLHACVRESPQVGTVFIPVGNAKA
jgi:hypothetical protein